MNPKTIKSLLAIALALALRAEAQVPINTNSGGYVGQGGTLQIVSGTGSFSAVSAANKVLNVPLGFALNGKVSLSAVDVTPSGDVVPLIFTPSWNVLYDSNNWQLIDGWIPIGQSQQTASISLTVPTTPGVYYIIFAFAWEKTPDQVASASNWELGNDVWDDGNDIAEFTAPQIAFAQLHGYVVNEWLFPGTSGTAQHVATYVPSDAITLIVGAPSSQPTLSLEMFENYPLLNLYGASGSNYVVQFNTNLAGTNWINLLSITDLSASPYPVIDYSGFGQPARFYRAFLMP